MITLAKAPPSGLNFGSHGRPRYTQIRVIMRCVIRRADCIQIFFYLGQVLFIFLVKLNCLKIEFSLKYTFYFNLTVHEFSDITQ